MKWWTENTIQKKKTCFLFEYLWILEKSSLKKLPFTKSPFIGDFIFGVHRNFIILGWPLYNKKKKKLLLEIYHLIFLFRIYYALLLHVGNQSIDISIDLVVSKN